MTARTVERYRQQGNWPVDPRLSPADFQRFAGLLADGGLISRVAPYDVVWRQDLADSVARAMAV